MKAFLILVLTFCALRLYANIPAILIIPSTPHQGDTLHIYCREHIAPEQDAYIRLTLYREDGTTSITHQILQRSQMGGSTAWVIPAGIASIHITMYTLSADLTSRDQLVYERNTLKPAVNAFTPFLLFGDNPDSVFQREIKNHPDNYYAYARYFNTVAMLKPDSISRAQIQASLPQLAVNSSKDPGLWAALCVGYAKTGDLAKAKLILFELMRLFPQSNACALAFQIYDYEYYKSSGKNTESDICDSIKPIFQKYPEAPICQDLNVFYLMSQDSSIDISVFEKVFMGSFYRREVPYYGMDALANLFIERHTKLHEAQAMLDTALNLWLSGDIQHQSRVDYRQFQKFVPRLLKDLSTLKYLQADYQATFEYASSALYTLKGSSMEGNYAPALVSLRDSAISHMGKGAWHSGSTAAAATAATAVTVATEDNAPDFTASDMLGHPISLNALQGKIVVMNFWDIGCGPCIAEIPELNKLVEHYRTDSNVVFLAPTGDAITALQPFFKRHKFSYQVLPDAATVARAYGLSSLPMHVVIDKKGNILSRSVGSRQDIVPYLEGLIEKAR